MQSVFLDRVPIVPEACQIRWCLWVWKSVQPRIWSEHGGTEHSTLIQGFALF